MCVRPQVAASSAYGLGLDGLLAQAASDDGTRRDAALGLIADRQLATRPGTCCQAAAESVLGAAGAVGGGLGSAVDEVRGWTLRGLAASAGLQNASVALVALNMLLMTMPYHGMEAGYAARLERANNAITYARGRSR